MIKNTKQGGFIFKLIVILVALVFIASYFKFDLKSFMESPETQSNIDYAVTLVVDDIWHGYLEAPVMQIWNNYLSVLIKDSFIQGINNLRAISGGNVGNLNIIPSAFPDNWSPSFDFGSAK